MRAHHEGGGAELFVEDDAVIAGIRLGQHRKLARRAPVETAAIDNDAADRGAVAAEPLGGRVHHDVGAEFDRPAEIRRREGVVDQQWNFCFMRDLCNLRDVQHLEAGIADGLADHEARVGLDRGAETVEVARLHEGGGDAEARQRVGQDIDRAAIQRRRRDDMFAGADERCDGEMQGGHAARRADRADAAFQRGDPLFEHRYRRIGNPGVDVAGTLEIEQRRRVIGVLKHERGGLVDRHRARAGERIRMLAGIKAERFEGGRLWRRHVNSYGRRRFDVASDMP